MPTNSTRAFLVAALLVPVSLTVPGLAAPPKEDPFPAEVEYRNWLDRLDENALREIRDYEPDSRLFILTFHGGAADDPAHITATLDGGVSGTMISKSGMARWFSEGAFGGRGGGSSAPLPSATLNRADELLTALPRDARRLPPPERRLYLRASVRGQTVVRLYDRANLPDQVIEILRLSDSHVTSYVPKYSQQSEIRIPGFRNGGIFKLSPGGQLLYTASNESLQIWDSTTHELLREMHEVDGETIAIKPDGSQAVIANYGGSHALDTHTWAPTKLSIRCCSLRFTPDGRHLLAQYPNRPLEIYDATTWQRVAGLPEIPGGSISFVPSPKGDRAVVQGQDQKIFLWDVVQHREIAPLTDHASLREAAFSPDESLVAVAMACTGGTNYWSALRLGIWQAQDGKLRHELRPFDTRVEANQGSNDMLWSPDGQYLLTGTTASDGTMGLGIFDAKTGRHRGQLSEIGKVNGVAFLPNSSQLVVGSPGGEIRFWDFADVMKQIHAFETSLPELPQ